MLPLFDTVCSVLDLYHNCISLSLNFDFKIKFNFLSVVLLILKEETYVLNVQQQEKNRKQMKLAMKSTV